MPPSVATSEVDVSAPKTSPCGSTIALSSPCTSPGSTTQRRPSRSISSARRISETSRASPGAVACPARLVPVPRGVMESPSSRAAERTSSHILLGAGDDDANGLAEVDGGVCGPQGARGFVGAQVTFEFTVEGGVELPRVRFGFIRHDPVNFTSRVDVPPVGDSHPGRRDGSFPLQWDKPPLRGAFPWREAGRCT